MKKIIFLIPILALCLSAGAQSMNSDSVFPKHYGSVSFCYSFVMFHHMNPDPDIYGREWNWVGYSDASPECGTGLGLIYTNATRLIPSAPLYVEYGGGIQYSFLSNVVQMADFFSIKGELIQTKGSNSNAIRKFFSVKVPVSVLYRFNIKKTKFSIVPYAGIDVAVYILGKQKVQPDCPAPFDSEENFFKRVEMNRFNIDWHAGAKFILSKFFLSVAYEGPILGFYQKNGIKCNMSQVINISVGYTW